ncbi:efflux RND transporter periplasmic adaptor subunit [Synechococcus sp. CBW1002]|uniref:efflux RND transporter periplasmic adaptor subunit n=1 Tax=Synechococcus sp. CBW1002 TaxID=1353134 RepID=UPI0018CF117A|nr:efflux RND transporter periplasmic adaptor subunit [Synechococcus sp. CBW1002]QPN61341.1 efflux RND transporter periplasmic adaptor subunit [Synechococcus sp. CBW1002]
MAVALSTLLLAACDKPAPPAAKPLVVSTAPVQIAPFSERVETVSTLEAIDEVQLAAQAGGRIQQLGIGQGDKVKAGQLLLVLDQVQLQADLATLLAREEKDKLNYQRYEYLVRQGAASAIQRDQFRAQYIESREAVLAKRADLAFRDLRSPIDGTVADVQVKVGDVISAGDPFTRLIRNDRLFARIDVPAIFSDRIRPGLPVTLKQAGSDRVLVEGRIDSVDPNVLAGSQALLVKAAFANPGGGLRNGQRLRATVELDRRQLPSVPFAAVTQSSGQSFVFRVGTLAELKLQPGKVPIEQLEALPPSARFALQTPVQLGGLQNNRYPVVQGLDSGRQVITSNLLNLRHGMPIKVN